MCAPENPHNAPAPIENIAADQETLSAILSSRITGPPRPRIQVIPLLYSFRVWMYPFPILYPPVPYGVYTHEIGHICCRTQDGGGDQNDNRPCYDIAAAEAWPAIPQLEENNQFDIILEYHVPDEETMDYIIARLRAKYGYEDEGSKHVQLFEGQREFPAASGNFVDEPGVSIEIRRFTAIED